MRQLSIRSTLRSGVSSLTSTGTSDDQYIPFVRDLPEKQSSTLIERSWENRPLSRVSERDAVFLEPQLDIIATVPGKADPSGDDAQLLPEAVHGSPSSGKPDHEADQVKSLLSEAQASLEKRLAKSAAKQRLAMDQPGESGKSRGLEHSTRRRYPKEEWQIQKSAIQEKLGGQTWNPRKRISPDSIAGVRSLHESNPIMYSTERLADYFQISPDAVRRILKSKWQPSEKEAVERRERWERRGERKWSDLASQGVRPPKRWRQRGIGDVVEGEMPTWRKGGGAIGVGGGERWIEHRSPEELFARAAAADAEATATQARTRPRVPRRSPAPSISQRFL